MLINGCEINGAYLWYVHGKKENHSYMEIRVKIGFIFP